MLNNPLKPQKEKNMDIKPTRLLSFHYYPPPLAPPCKRLPHVSRSENLQRRTYYTLESSRQSPSKD